MVVIDPEEKKPAAKRSHTAAAPKQQITANDISTLLSLLFSVLSASLPDTEYVDFGKNPPEKSSLRELWDIPSDEIDLIAQPAARILSRASSEAQARIVKNWDMLTLAIGLAGVIGLRGVKHYEIIAAVKSSQPSARVNPGAGGQNQNHGAGGDTPSAPNVWERFRSNDFGAGPTQN